MANTTMLGRPSAKSSSQKRSGLFMEKLWSKTKMATEKNKIFNTRITRAPNPNSYQTAGKRGKNAKI